MTPYRDFMRLVSLSDDECPLFITGCRSKIHAPFAHRIAFLGWWCHLRLLCRLMHEIFDMIVVRFWQGTAAWVKGPPPTAIVEWNNGIMMMKMAFNLTSCLHHKSRRAKESEFLSPDYFSDQKPSWWWLLLLHALFLTHTVGKMHYYHKTQPNQTNPN